MTYTEYFIDYWYVFHNPWFSFIAARASSEAELLIS